MNQPNMGRAHRWALVTGLLLITAAVAAGMLAFSIQRLRWRVEIVQLKIEGGLPDISWKELYHLNQHGDPYNLKGLLVKHTPYIAIANPYSNPQNQAEGERLFQRNCSFCHGNDGTGGRSAPALRQRQMIHGSTDWALFKTISNGVAGTDMPASALPEEDRWKMAAFVKSIAEGAQAGLSSPSATRLARISPVNYENILHGQMDSHNWLTYSGSYDGQRFSQNDQLNTENVSKLRVVWMRQYPEADAAFETSPLIVDGFMFITTPPNRVEALDAETGEVIWTYDRALPQHILTCCGYVNRGLAVLGKELFLGTLDAHLVALDIRTGAVIWDVEVGDAGAGYSITSAPLALKNMVITGVAGGEFGARGFVSARDVSTGKEIWRFNTIPGLGEPGSETWEAAALKTGGGPTWLTGTYDKDLNLVFWPVGNPSPNYEGDGRKGDNLYTNCVVALDGESGSLRWYFQFTPHDQHDWDATEILIAFDRTVRGKTQRFLAQADRNAFYYLLDRENGHFLNAKPFARQNWARGIDSQGRPVLDPAAIPKPEGATAYPSVAGATNWMSPSYNPVTGLVYVPVAEAGGNFSTAHSKYEEGRLFLGGASQTFTNPPQQAGVRALDAVTGEMRWEHLYQSWNAGGVLSTKGGLVFGGLGNLFVALDAKDGRELWRVDTGGSVRAAPVSYFLNGKQYVTVAAGHSLLTFAE